MNKFQIVCDRFIWSPPPVGLSGFPHVMADHSHAITRGIKRRAIIPSMIEHLGNFWPFIIRQPLVLFHIPRLCGRSLRRIPVHIESQVDQARLSKPSFRLHPKDAKRPLNTRFASRPAPSPPVHSGAKGNFLQVRPEESFIGFHP